MNPNNVTSLYGTIGTTSNIQFLKHQEKEFAVRFPLVVPRVYKNPKGVYDTDTITVKFEFDAAKSSFAHSLEPGDRLQVIGSIRCDPYKGSYLFYVMADSMSFDEETRRKKYAKEQGEEIVSEDIYIDVELPY